MKVRIPNFARFNSTSAVFPASALSPQISSRAKISPTWLAKYLRSKNQNSHLTRPLYRCLNDLRSRSPHHVRDPENLEGQDEISFRMRKLAAGIKAVAEYPEQIRSISEMKGIRGIGNGIRKRCQMVFLGQDPLDYVPLTRTCKLNKSRRSMAVPSSTLHRLSSNSAPLHTSSDPRLLQDLQLVRGIGPAKAQSLVSAGCRSLQHLNEQFKDQLSKKQLTALQDLLGFGERMKAQESKQNLTHTSKPTTDTNGLPDQTQPVAISIPSSHLPSKTEESTSKEYKRFAQLFDVLQSELTTVDSKLRLHPVGAFRRGKIPQSLEVLLEHPRYDEVIAPVEGAGSEDVISIALGGETKVESDHDGISDSRTDLKEIALLRNVVEQLGEAIEGSLKGKGRQFEGSMRGPEGRKTPLLIRLTSPETLSSSLLFHTGDVHYIRFLRTLASEAYGSYLDSQGLWRRAGTNGWERIGKGEGHPKLESEEEILDALGMVYLEPHERVVKPPRVNRETEL